MLSIREKIKEHGFGQAEREHILESLLCYAKKVGLILLARCQQIFSVNVQTGNTLGFADPILSFRNTQVFFIVYGYFHAMEELSLYMSFVSAETKNKPDLAHGP